MGLLTDHDDEPPLVVDAMPGGFSITESGDENHWWSVIYRGSTPIITSPFCENVTTHSPLGRRILAAIRESAAQL